MTAVAPGTVSVIIPTFNRFDLIQRAIASALGQTYPVHEIVVVDDGSTDNTIAGLAALNLPRLVLISLKSNVGQAAATNIGIEAATGDFVTFLDSDDFWEINKISLQMALASKTANPECTVISSRVRISGPGYPSRVRPRKSLKDTENAIDYMLSKDGLLQTSTLLMPRKFAREVRLDEAEPTHSDLSFAIRLAEKGAKFHMVEEPCTIWWETPPRQRLSAAPHGLDVDWWLIKYSSVLTPFQKSSYAARYILPTLLEDDFLKAISILSRALYVGAITPLQGMNLIVKRLVPHNLYWRLLRRFR